MSLRIIGALGAILTIPLGHACSPAANIRGAPLVFDGLPVSVSTTPAVLALIEESREHVDLESTTRAHDLAVRATEQAPESILAWLHRAEAALSPEEVAQAIAKAEALEGSANPAERTLLAIRVARQRGDTDGALAAAKKLLELAPKSPEAYLVLSRVYTLRGEDREARVAAIEATELDPRSLSAHALLGESYTFREPRDLAKAAFHFQKTVELRPKIAATYVSLGDVYRAGLDLAAAAEQYGKAMEADPTYPVGPIKRGHVNSFLGNYDQARADYDAGIALGTTRFALSLSNYRAFVSIYEGQPAAALAELGRLLDRVRAASLPVGEKNELEIYVLENRATVALHLASSQSPTGAGNAVQEGVRQKALAAVGELVATHRRIGAATQDSARKRQSESDAAYWQGRLELVSGNFAAATTQAEAYARSVATDTGPRKMERYHELRGLIALGQKNYDEAVESLRRADLQSVVFAKYHLALALAGAGKTEEARTLFRGVADWSFNSPDYALLRRLATERAGTPAKPTGQ